MRLYTPEPDAEVQRSQLVATIDLLDKHSITYHLEGGTLLGIVRDGDLLPWDKDTDISIMSADLSRLLPVLDELKALGWRITERSFEQHEAFAHQEDVRLVKVKDRFLKVLAGANTLDLFVKYIHEGYAYWIADSNVMRVSAHHYEGFETVPWEGRQVKVPVDYEGYLEAKFGNWKVPQKEWHCDMEQTVVRPRADDN